MASHQSHEFSGSCTDGVRVKISEKYKPPPRIGLAMSYAQRLTLNKQIQDTIPQYEFLLEKTVIDKIKQLKTARSVMFQDLKDRVEKARLEHRKTVEEKQEFQKQDDKEQNFSTPLYLNSHQSSQTYQQTQNILMPTQINATGTSFSNILTPIQLRDQNWDHKSPDKSPFNISDFEADTSSPFDNMELKSINDLEVLAQVLKGREQEARLPVTFSSAQSCSAIGTSSTAAGTSNTFDIPTTSNYIRPVNSSIYNSVNGYYYTADKINPAFNSRYYSNQMASTTYNSPSGQDINVAAYKSVPDIIKSLQTELNNAHTDNTKKIEPPRSRENEVFPRPKIKNEEAVEEFSSLPKNLQDMSKAISSMGFPLSRVARVCKIVGNDQKRVVEHLLAMSDLLDLGFPENKVSTALLQCNNDRDKALDILIS